MPQIFGANWGRLDGSVQRTTLTAASFALGVGWGDGTLVKTLTAGSNDQRGELVITSVGSNQAQATATVIHTFADGEWPAAPWAFQNTTNDNSIDTGRFKPTTVTTTAVTWTFSLLPVATKIYILRYFLLG